MRILISQSESETGEELNYELGESLPFTQILDKLQAWAESQGLFIIDYRVAAKPEAAEKTELTSDEIDVINLQLGDQLQLVESNLRELIDYTDRAGLHLARTIQEGKSLSENEERDLKNGGAFIAESFDALSRYLVAENPENIAGALNALNTNPDLVEKINALALLQNQLRLWLRYAEFSRVSPAEAADKVALFREKLPALQQDVEQIAARFTQGKEQDALVMLETISSTLIDAVVLMRKANDAKMQIGEKLVGLMGQLTAAIDARDLVTAADIVDFDLRDLLKEM
jgi:monoamine oxidase